MKRLLALSVVTALAWTAPGLGAFEACAASLRPKAPRTPVEEVRAKAAARLVPALDADTAVAVFVGQKVLKSPADPRLRYLVEEDERDGTRTLTGLGLLLSDYLVLLEGVRKLQPPAVPAVEEKIKRLEAVAASPKTLELDRPVFQRLAKKYRIMLDGQRALDVAEARATETKIAEVMRQIGEDGPGELVEQRLKKINELSSALQDLKLNGEDIASVGAALNTVLTGVREIQASGGVRPDLNITEEDGVLTAVDKKTGELYRQEDRQGHIFFSRELLDRQKRYNAFIRGPGGFKGVPLVPETGAMNQGTLAFPYHEMRAQLDQLRAHLRMLQLYALMELTGEQNFRPDQLSDPAEQAKLIAKLSAVRLSDGKLAGEKVAELFASYQTYIDAAERALSVYKTKLDLIGPDTLVTNELLEALKGLEQEARAQLSLAWTEGQIHLASQQRRKIGDPKFMELIQKSELGKELGKLLEQFGDQRDKLAERIEQVIRLYQKVQQALKAGRDPKQVELAQRLYAETQGQGQALQLALQAYGSSASLLKAVYETNSAHDKGFLGSGLSVKYATDWWAGLATEKLGWFSGHSARVRNVAAAEGALRSVFKSVAEGNYEMARAGLANMVPPEDAEKYISIQPGQALTELTRMAASIDALNAELGSVQNVHFWAQFGTELVLSTALIAVAAPAMTAGLTSVARGSKLAADGIGAARGATMLGRAGTALIQPVGWGLRGAERISESFAWGFESLNSAAHVPAGIQGPTFVRGWNMLTRSAVASTSMAGISGGITAAGHYVDGLHFWRANEHSPYRDGWEAFGTGAKFGAEFPVKLENLPWLVGGLPGHLFGLSNPVGKVWFNMSKGGLVGGSVAAVAGRDLVGETLGAWGLKGGVGFVGSFGLGMADQLAKYYLFNEVVAQGFEKGRYYGGKAYRAWEGTDADLTEEALRKRLKIGEDADPDAAAKRLQDLTPAEREIALMDEGLDKSVAIHQLQERALAEREAVRWEEARKAEAWGREVGWRFVPVFPANMMVNAEEFYAADQGMRQYREAGRLHEIANSAAGAELPMVTPAEMPLYQRAFMRGAQKRTPEVQRFRVSEEMKAKAIREELALATRNDPAELYRVSQMPEDAMLGGRLRVTKEVHTEAKDAFEDILLKDPKLATDLLHTEQPQLARRVLEAQDPKLASLLEGRGKGAPKTEAAPGSKEPTKADAKAALERASQSLREEAALAVANNAGSGFLARAKAVFSGQAANIEKAQQVLELYSGTKKAVIAAGKEFLTAVKSNKEPSTALRGEAEAILAETRQWRDSTDPTDNTASYMKLVERWKSRLSELQGLGAGDAASLKGMIGYVEAMQARFAAKKTVNGRETPLIENAKGAGITGMRPEQFSVLMEFLCNVTAGGRQSSEYMRAFLKLSTGGGKTLLVFEGLLPIISADAEIVGESGAFKKKPKIVFITSNTLLESQARTDFKAFRDVVSDVEIMTAEEFKSRIAEGKMWGNKGRPEDYWVIADEFDGLALQPALTIGEQTAIVSREHPAYRRLETLAEEMNAVAQAQGLGPAQVRAAVKNLKAEQGRVLREAEILDKGKAAELKLLLDQMGQAALETGGQDKLAGLRERYAQALEAGVQSENPVYEVYRRMSEDASRDILSPMREKGPAAFESFEKLKLLGREAESTLARGPSEAAAKQMDALAARQEVLLKDAIFKDPAGAEGLRSAMKAMQEAARSGGRPAEALGRSYREALQSGVSPMDYAQVMERVFNSKTHQRSAELFKALWKDPMLDMPTKTSFMLKTGYSWVVSLRPSTLLRKPAKLLPLGSWARASAERTVELIDRPFEGLSRRSWVGQEMLNLAQGLKEGEANVRMDNITNKVHPIHNGEFVPSMDTPTRRYHELKNGADLTLPYEHREISTVRDLTERPKVRFLGTSGTNPDLLAAHLIKNKVSVLGEGTKPNTVEPVLFENPSAKFNAIAREYREKIATGQRDILVVGFSNTRELKQVNEMLTRMGVEKKSIAKIFSDTEYLRNNYPKARIKEQMNLEAIKTGEVKVLLMDMRVGGRGLDLPFRDGKYNKADILILDPQEIAGVHDIQFQGRTAPNRMPDGAQRGYFYYTDAQTAGKNPTMKRLTEGKVTVESFKRTLAETQKAAELDQLRSSSVLHDAPETNAGEAKK